jgi:hypothetical protein
LLKNRARLREHLEAIDGQPGRSRNAVEQRPWELTLQFANVARHARLDATKLAPGCLERTHVRNRNQCFEL